jgi:hypothetical protein
LGLAVKNAIRLLESLRANGLVVEVTHRAKRRLFGLRGVEALADAVRPPDRPQPGRGRGRPPIPPAEDAISDPPHPLPPLSPIERRAFDYSGLEAAMAQLDQTVRQTKRVLDGMARRASAGPDALPASGEAAAAEPSRGSDIDIGDRTTMAGSPSLPEDDIR